MELDSFTNADLICCVIDGFDAFRQFIMDFPGRHISRKPLINLPEHTLRLPVAKIRRVQSGEVIMHPNNQRLRFTKDANSDNETANQQQDEDMLSQNQSLPSSISDSSRTRQRTAWK